MKTKFLKFSTVRDRMDYSQNRYFTSSYVEKNFPSSQNMIQTFLPYSPT